MINFLHAKFIAFQKHLMSSLWSLYFFFFLIKWYLKKVLKEAKRTSQPGFLHLFNHFAVWDYTGFLYSSPRPTQNKQYNIEGEQN